MTSAIDNRVVQETEKFLENYAGAIAAGAPTRPRINEGLFSLLECPHQSWSMFEATIVSPRHAVDNEAAIQQLLPRIFLALAGQSVPQDDLTSILGGLHNAQCWRGLLATEEGAYVLAASLVGFVDASNKTFALNIAVAPAVCAMLNSWLKPEQDWAVLPSAGIVCAHFFGHAWSQLSLPEDYWMAGGFSTKSDIIRGLVLQARPPFVPGLCSAQMNVLSAPLPELNVNAAEFAS